MNEVDVLLIIIAIIPFLLFFLRIILLTWRYYVLSQHLKQTVALEQARRQMELNSNNPNDGTLNDISILPKNLDLPPTYDEVITVSTAQEKQQIQPAQSVGSIMTITGAVSTITIETDLESSNNNLAELELPEQTRPRSQSITMDPPPAYESHMTSASTIACINENTV